MKIITTIFFLAIFFTAESFTKDNKFQQCIKFLEAGKLHEVLELSKNLPENESHHILSLYYMYKGDYKTALIEIEKTDLKENRQNLFIYLKNLIKITENFEEFETENFRIRLSKNDLILKKHLTEKAKKIFTKIGKVFNYFPEEKLLIEIYPDKE
ncbi:MAG: hypothetical protein ACK4JE_03950, partial [Endomicrobiia bacterium]